MLRTLARSQLRTVSSTKCTRNFVSTVLLSKTYENKSVAELRELARSKGLPISGSKATLITRIQQKEEKNALDAIAPESVAPKQAQPQTRDLSTSAPARATVASSTPSTSSFDVRLPDLSEPTPESPVQIPFVPDFWDSSKVKAEERASQPIVPETPKIVITAGAATHAVGPTYNLTETNDSIFLPTELPSSSTSSSASKKPTGILGDIVDDLGIPPEVFAAKSDAPAQEQFPAFEKTYSRPLEADEKTGAYALLGILFGSWLVAGFGAPVKEKKAKPAQTH